MNKTQVNKLISQFIAVFSISFATGVGYLVSSLAGLAAAVVYYLSNFLWVSSSLQDELSPKDILKGVLIGAFTGVLTYLSGLVPGVVISWAAIWTAALSGMGMYFTQTLTQGKKKGQEIDPTTPPPGNN